MICFVHIERAGGTTLHYILRNNYLSFLTLTPTLWSNEETEAFNKDELRAILRLLPFTRGIGGHNVRAYLGYDEVARRPVKYFTFVREPMARYISHFNYQVFEMGIGWTKESFLAESRFDNFMTKRIAGTFDIETAKKRLVEDFAFVGMCEHFDESLILMRDALGLENFDIRYERVNASRDLEYRQKRDELLADADFMRAASGNNKLDLELYAFIKERIFPQFMTRHGAKLDRDLAQYRESMRHFRFSRARKRLWETYRYLFYRNLELSVRRKYRHTS